MHGSGDSSRIQKGTRRRGSKTLSTNNYRKYLQEDGTIDEDQLEDDLRQNFAFSMASDIEEEVEHRMESEKEELLLRGLKPNTPDYEVELQCALDLLREEVTEEIEEGYELMVQETKVEMLRQFDEETELEQQDEDSK